jgi:serine protease SohB
MEFLSEYGMFVAKLVTLVGIVGLFVLGVFILFMRSRMTSDEHLEVKNLNHKYEQMALALQSAMLPKKAFKQVIKKTKAEHKAEDQVQPSEEANKRHVFVLNFKGDIRASQVSSLREEISAVLKVAAPDDEVVVALESGGGTVHGYGLGASQLQRIRDRGIKLTVAVDKIAASGGYMMACVANQVIAAPFAIIGSIGVIAQIPNFHRLLKKHDIDYEQIVAGEHKRTLTMFGENTDEDREKLREEIEEAHELFKTFVSEHREQVDLNAISTGEHWYGRRALELNLIDKLETSDDYLLAAGADASLLEITYVRHKPLIEKWFSSAAKVVRRTVAETQGGAAGPSV